MCQIAVTLSHRPSAMSHDSMSEWTADTRLSRRLDMIA